MGRLTFGRIILALTGLLIAGAVLSVIVIRLAQPPVAPGLSDGRLAPCPASPNCVSSQSAGGYAQQPPLTFDGDPAAAQARLVAVIEQMPGTRIETQSADYIHATFRSATFGFIDDAQFLIDADAGVIHFRSASRLGYGDLNANADRIAAIRAALGG